MNQGQSTSVWILGDQLLKEHPAIAEATKETHQQNVVILLIESTARAEKRPYQRKKLVLLWSAMRHYARALREGGYTVDYRQSDRFSDALREHIAAYRPAHLLTMAAADHAGRHFQQAVLPTLMEGRITVLPNSQFLAGRHNPIPDPEPDRRYVMEYFYRDMRRYFDVLLDEEGKPAGGKWNYDHLNRERLPENVSPPPIPGFPPDEITQQVVVDVQSLKQGTGTSDNFELAVTHVQAEQMLADFIEHRLPNFGTYEDAMTTRHQTLFHSVLSPYLNLGLLEPLQVITAAVAAYEGGQAPINSVEGFVRQALGWREFVYWQYWRQMPALANKNDWQAARSLPGFFWDGQTEMNCMRCVIDRALTTGYTHHIERLMVLSNFCMLAGVRPQEVVDWFISSYVDAYDWVMQPNVVGMGLNADGGLTATKPYISSANYINRMSDYCNDCAFHPGERTGENACPFNFLYWNFLLTHEKRLRANPRLGRSVYNLRHLDDEERQAVRQQAQEFLQSLS